MKIPSLSIPKLPPQKWLFIAILAFVALIITLLATRPFSLKVTQTDPRDQQTEVPLNYLLTVTFNRPVNSRIQPSLLITFEPPVTGQISFSADQTQAVFQPNDFYQPDTQYTVTVTGQTIKDFTFTFHTRTQIELPHFPLLNPSSPPAGPQSLQEKKQQLLSHLPYYGKNFYIQYTLLGDFIYVNIFTDPVEQAKQQAIAWLKTQGFDDPENQLNIRYTFPKSFNPK